MGLSQGRQQGCQKGLQLHTQRRQCCQLAWNIVHLHQMLQNPGVNSHELC